MAEKYFSKLLITKEVLNSDQLKKFTEHKYNSEGFTILDPYFEVIWQWIEKRIPETWAPNSLTITGLLTNAITTFVLVCYCPTFTEVAPWWAYFLCAFGVFLYQALDILDGKQCRRTNNDTSLEALVDHSCDALSIVFLALTFSISLQLGYLEGSIFLAFFSSLTTCYCAHWQHYTSGCFRVQNIDNTEALLVLIIIHLISGTFGPQIWSMEIFGIQLKAYILLFALLPGVMHWVMDFSQIVKGGVGKSKLTVAETSVIMPIFNLFTLILLDLIIIMKSEGDLLRNYTCLYYLMFGMVFVRVTTKLIVAGMSESPIEYLDSSWIGPGLMILNQYCNHAFPEYWVLWLALVFSTFNHAQYAITVTTQISDQMGCYVFDITKKKNPTTLYKNKNKN